LSADGKVPETMRLTCNQCPQIELASVLAICNTYVRVYPGISAIGLCRFILPISAVFFVAGGSSAPYCGITLQLNYILRFKL
jgi:hypothetical protein